MANGDVPWGVRPSWEQGAERGSQPTASTPSGLRPHTPLQLPQTENPKPSILQQPRVFETISYTWSLTFPRPNLLTSKPMLLAMRGRWVKGDPPTRRSFARLDKEENS